MVVEPPGWDRETKLALVPPWLGQQAKLPAAAGKLQLPPRLSVTRASPGSQQASPFAAHINCTVKVFPATTLIGAKVNDPAAHVVVVLAGGGVPTRVIAHAGVGVAVGVAVAVAVAVAVIVAVAVAVTVAVGVAVAVGVGVGKGAKLKNTVV